MTDKQYEYYHLYAQGYTVTEIARRCGKAKNTVSAALKRAREGARHKDYSRKNAGLGYGKYVPCPYGRDCFACTAPDCYEQYAHRYNILPTDRATLSELGGVAQ